MADPLNEQLIDEVKLITRCSLDVCCSSGSDILNALKQYHGIVPEEKPVSFSSLHRDKGVVNG